RRASARKRLTDLDAGAGRRELRAWGARPPARRAPGRRDRARSPGDDAAGRAGGALVSGAVRRLETRLEGPVLIEPAVHGDERGFFAETYRRSAFEQLGIRGDFDPASEQGIKYDDPDVGIAWPEGLELTPSQRDASAPLLRDVADDLPFVYVPPER